MFGRVAIVAAAIGSAYIVARRPDLLGRIQAAADRVAEGLRGTITVFVDEDGDGEIDPGESAGSGSWTSDDDLDNEDSIGVSHKAATAHAARCGCSS